MKQYIGTKRVMAEPAWRVLGPGERVRIWSKETVEDPTPGAGCVIQDGYKVVYQDGYERWSPKEVFEAAYREVDGMSFGLALEAVKLGFRAARKGWNGKRMYVFLAHEPDFNTPQGELQLGWLASRNDLLADDWYILPEDLIDED